MQRLVNATEHAGHCSSAMYEEMQEVSTILLHPLESLGLRVPKPGGVELGRGLRTLLSALKHRLAVVATDTPWFRAHLASYSCAHLVPPGEVAGYYVEGLVAAAQIAASHNNTRQNRACASAGPHDFTQERGVAAFAEWLPQHKRASYNIGR